MVKKSSKTLNIKKAIERNQLLRTLTKNQVTKQNKTNKNKRNQQGRKANLVYGSLSSRTDCKEIGIKSTTNLKELQQTLHQLNIKKLSVFKIFLKKDAKPTTIKDDNIVTVLGSNSDYNFLRGGLTKEESKVIYKTVCSKSQSIKHAENNNRFLNRPKGKERKALVYLDNADNIICIHLLNILDEEILTSRDLFLKKHFDKLLGWCKSCGLSGHIVAPEIIKRLRKNKKAMESYFGKQYDRFKLLNIKIAGEGEGTSAKSIYVNSNNQVKEFQVGKCFEFVTTFFSFYLIICYSLILSFFKKTLQETILDGLFLS